MAANADNKGRQTWVEQIGEQEYQCASTARGILFAINAIYIAFVRSLHGRQIAYKYQSVPCARASACQPAIMLLGVGRIHRSVFARRLQRQIRLTKLHPHTQVNALRWIAI